MAYLESVIERHSAAIIVAFAAATLLAAVVASGVTIDGSVDHLMMSGDPARQLDQLAKEEFGNDEILMIGLELGAPYSPTDLHRLRAITDRLEEVPGVDRVKSLANTEDIRGREDELDASALVDFDALTESFDAIRARTLEHRLYDDLLVSPEQDAFGVLVYADDAEANSQAMNVLTASVIETVEAMADPWRAHYAGYPVTAFEVNRIVKRDLAVLTPIALLAIGAILWLFTRRLFPLGLLLALIVWVEAAAHAFLAWRAIPINVVVSILPTVLVATSATYVIYTVGMLARVSGAPAPGVALVRSLARPVLLSGLSTGIGFASLSLIEVEAIGDLGAALAVGMLAAMLGALLLVPACIEVFGLRLELRRLASMQRLSMSGVELARRPWAVVVATGALLALAAPGVARLTVHTDTLDYFASDNFVRVGADFFEEHMASAFLLNFVIRADEASRMLDADTLAFADRLAAELETMADVDRTISMLDYFYMMDAALRPGETPSSNPGSRSAAAQYMLLYESSGDPQDYDRYINFDRSALSLIASAHGGSSVYIDIARRVERLAEQAPEGVRVDSLGSVYLYSRAMDSLTRGMLTGLGVAVLLVGVVMIVGLRSVKLALVAAIPNLTPLFLGASLLGWLGVPISMSTSLVGCLALGLAVDDTAHVMGHVRPDESLEGAYRTVGPCVLLTTLALGLGFGALDLSEFETVRMLGFATTSTLLLALLADLLLLPSLLVILGLPRSAKGTETADAISRAPTQAPSPT